jgi:hypothetical protein
MRDVNKESDESQGRSVKSVSAIGRAVVNLPSLALGIDSARGLGDINPTFFLSPAKSGQLIWGVWPTFTLRTATNSVLGNGKWKHGSCAADNARTSVVRVKAS